MHVQLTLSLPWHGIATWVQVTLLIQPWIVHQVPISAGCPEAVWIQSLPKALHTTGAAGIEPQTFGSLLQCPNRSATHSTIY